MDVNEAKLPTSIQPATQQAAGPSAQPGAAVLSALSLTQAFAYPASLLSCYTVTETERKFSIKSVPKGVAP